MRVQLGLQRTQFRLQGRLFPFMRKRKQPERNADPYNGITALDGGNEEDGVEQLFHWPHFPSRPGKVGVACFIKLEDVWIRYENFYNPVKQSDEKHDGYGHQEGFEVLTFDVKMPDNDVIHQVKIKQMHGQEQENDLYAQLKIFISRSVDIGQEQECRQPKVQVF